MRKYLYFSTIRNVLFVCSLMLGMYQPLMRASSATGHLSTVFSKDMRAEFAPFLDNVLRQVPSKRFFSAVDGIQKSINPSDDVEWYKQLLEHASSMKVFVNKFLSIGKLRALYHQRNVLSGQIKQLIPVTKRSEIKTCLEIGQPGTYTASVRGVLPNLNEVYVLNDKKSPVDRVQTITFSHPLTSYDHFVPLDDYNPISSKQIPAQSVDLVICTIGLHHAPPEKLEHFVRSIRTVLRPGGIFILRDHDVSSSKMYSIVHVAHSVFNAVISGTTVAAECAEVRNFQSISFWVNLLERNGFSVTEDRLLQEGDPTENTMIRADATPRNAAEQMTAVTKELSVSEDYTRDISQTYLTSPEWVNVDVAQEYGSFINHTPFYEFPYLSSVGSYWKVFGDSFKTAAHKRGVFSALFSSYTMMNLFVGSGMTVEYCVKAAMSAPLRLMYGGTEDGSTRALVHDPAEQLSVLHPQVKIVKRYSDNLVLADLPRYKQFLTVVKALPRTRCVFQEIAGNKEIQCKVRFKTSEQRAALKAMNECAIAYEWDLPTQPGYTYAGVIVSVNTLHQFVKELDCNAIDLLYVHDF